MQTSKPRWVPLTHLTCANGRKGDRSVRVGHAHLQGVFHDRFDFYWVSLSTQVEDLLTLEVAWLGYYDAWVGQGT